MVAMTNRASRASTYAGLFGIAERHAATPAARQRTVHPDVVAPYEAVRLVTMLVSGSLPLEQGEEPATIEDVAAALSLLGTVRAEVDEQELALLACARGRGMSWQQVADALGLRSPQAAQQRHERLVARSAWPPPDREEAEVTHRPHQPGATRGQRLPHLEPPSSGTSA